LGFWSVFYKKLIDKADSRVPWRVNIFLEAMAAGFPVLAPLRGGVPTYLEHGVSGFLIDTGSAQSIRNVAENILLSESEERLRRVAERGRHFILHNFGIDKMPAGSPISTTMC
jgi:glycosyltransferase involved in cell wall biosynthesis